MVSRYLIFVALAAACGSCAIVGGNLPTIEANSLTATASVMLATSTLIKSSTPVPLLTSTTAPSATEPPAFETATPTPIVVFQERFEDPNSLNWYLREYDDSAGIAKNNVSFDENSLRFEAFFKKEDITWARLYADVNYLTYIQRRDFDMSILAMIDQSSDIENTYLTFHFRINNNFDNYSLRLRGDGAISLVVRTQKDYFVIQDWVKGEVPIRLTEWNKIRVIANGSQFLIYINEQKLSELPYIDTTLLNSGGFAYGLRAPINTFVIAHFKDLEIYEYDEQ